MKDQRKFAVDFYLAGTVTVKAKNKDEAVSKANQLGLDKVIECLENGEFGKYYVDEL